MTNITTTNQVTREQLNRVERIESNVEGTFYLVQSSHYKENGQEYKVAALHIDGKYHLTCTCPAGLNGRTCWHVRAAVAHAALMKVEAREQVTATPQVVTNVDSETLARVQAAKGPQHKEASVQAASRRYASKPFSLLK